MDDRDHVSFRDDARKESDSSAILELTLRFMYGFAQVISWIRSICRAGTLYFIRDPHDPNYSAVKDMIERPAHSQLRKVCWQADMNLMRVQITC